MTTGQPSQLVNDGPCDLLFTDLRTKCCPACPANNLKSWSSSNHLSLFGFFTHKELDWDSLAKIENCSTVFLHNFIKMNMACEDGRTYYSLLTCSVWAHLAKRETAADRCKLTSLTQCHCPLSLVPLATSRNFLKGIHIPQEGTLTSLKYVIQYFFLYHF